MGEYAGRYGGGIERFSLRSDGTFTQRFERGGEAVYSLEGLWSLDGRYVKFRPFITQRWPTASGELETREIGTGVAVWSPGERLAFDEEQHYWVERE